MEAAGGSVLSNIIANNTFSGGGTINGGGIDTYFRRRPGALGE